MKNTIFNRELIDKYATQGPRYTSYPTAVQFDANFTCETQEQTIKLSNEEGKEVSLYVHIPFCQTVCYYCACNKIITKNTKHANLYLNYLEKEIKMQASLVDDKRKVTQLHWGGGTPTFLSLAEQWELTNMLRENFNFVGDDEGEFSIEIDPRTIDKKGISELRKMGFNRLSFGIQDFNKKVQVATNRIQSYEDTKIVIDEGRKQGFHSISVDLIYGLPLQTVATFEKTIDQIIELSPDRIAVFNYAHLPHLFKTQKQIIESQLPSSEEKLKLLEMSINKLVDSGYVFIGLDHFAKPEDSLVKHQNDGTLYRNFQGYSTFSNCDMLGFGASSISMVANTYSQNEKNKDAYYEILDANKLTTVRGVTLTDDDIIRRKVITEIMCNMKLDLNAISKQFDINAKEYFAKELQELQKLADDGLIEFTEKGLVVAPPGRLLIRNICMIFDIYLKKTTGQSFSKVI